MNKEYKLEKPSYYAIIPANVRYDKDLKPNAKLLYGEISCLCNSNGHCWATNSYFAELYGVTKETISRLISQLAAKGYIKVVITYLETGEIDKRYISIAPSIPVDLNVNIDEKINRGIDEKINRGIDEKINRGIDKKINNNNTSNNNTSNNNTSNNIKEKNIKKEKEFIDLKFIDDSIEYVELTQENYDKLIEKYDKSIVHRNIQSLDTYITNTKKGKNYKDHYKVLINWINREIDNKKENSKPKNTYTTNVNNKADNDYKPSGFNNFKAREYDYDDLENKLLGWE